MTEKLQIIIDPEGQRIVIGEAVIRDDGTIDGVLNEVEYIGPFRGYVDGFSIIPDIFRSGNHG
jgi:hypothetical protein